MEGENHHPHGSHGPMKCPNCKKELKILKNKVCL